MLNRGITAMEAAQAALEAIAGGSAIAVVLAVDGPAAGRRVLLRETGESQGTLGDAALDQAALALARRTLGTGETTVETVDSAAGPTTLYAEAHRAPDALLIVGAGHIAVPLAQIGALLGYRITVLDDREDFATPARFPDAAAVVRADFADPFRDVAITPRTHVVLVTRAHRYDFDCLRRLVDGDVVPRYIGMVGSRRRVRAAFRALLEAGVPRERLAGIHAPIGLDIGAETPAEIAVSVAAELVAVRARAGGGERNGAGEDRGRSMVGDAAGAEPAVRARSSGGAAGPPRPAPQPQPEGRRGSGGENEPLRDRERVLDRLLPEKGASDG